MLPFTRDDIVDPSAQTPPATIASQTEYPVFEALSDKTKCTLHQEVTKRIDPGESE
jgi:hypothetical protein